MESILRGASIYFIVLVVLRLSGRRTLAQMTTFDLVLVLIISETTQQALLADDFSITNATLVMTTLCGLNVLLSYIKEASPLAERILDGVPTVLISRGKPDSRAIRRARVDMKDILEAAREQHGLERLDQIKFAVLEIGGNISIVPDQGQGA